MLFLSLLSKVIEFAFADKIDTALEVTSEALNNVARKVEVSRVNHIEKLFEKELGTEVLVIYQHPYTWNDFFEIYDENKQVKYTVKGDHASIKRHLHVFDKGNREIGMVREKMRGIKSPFSYKAKPKQFEIFVYGKKLGKVKLKYFFGKPKHEVLYNGWHIDGNILGTSYRIISNNEEVAVVSNKVLLTQSDMYVASFHNIQYELDILLLVLTLDIANAPTKTEEHKSIRHERIRNRTDYKRKYRSHNKGLF